jgi:hypothetical protein
LKKVASLLFIHEAAFFYWSPAIRLNADTLIVLHQCGYLLNLHSAIQNLKLLSFPAADIISPISGKRWTIQMIKLNVKIWGMPLLIFWLYTILIGIISALVSDFAEKDFCIGTVMGVGCISLLWVLTARYKKFGMPIRKCTKILLVILTVAAIVGTAGHLILLWLRHTYQIS